MGFEESLRRLPYDGSRYVLRSMKPFISPTKTWVGNHNLYYLGFYSVYGMVIVIRGPLK